MVPSNEGGDPGGGDSPWYQDSCRKGLAGGGESEERDSDPGAPLPPMERAVWATLLLLLLVAALEGYRINFPRLKSKSASRPARRRKGGRIRPASPSLFASDFHRSLSGSPYCVRSNFVAARADGCVRAKLTWSHRETLFGVALDARSTPYHSKLQPIGLLHMLCIEECCCPAVTLGQSICAPCLASG